MAVNFCLDNYSALISCSQVSADGYNIQNLTSSNPSLRRKGFYVEYFIKPPVDVHLVFPIPLEIHSITIGMQVGSQQTSALEIWTSCSSDQDEYQKIGFVNTASLQKVTFVNKRYQTRKFFSSLPMPQLPENSFPLSARWRNHVIDVSRLKLLITRTKGSSIPCLSELNVWAQPSRNCPKQDLQWILRRALFDESNVVKINETFPEVVAVDKSENENDDIPEEFLDPITYTIMTLPVLLPSGHTVDQSTLDRFTDSEASWGRQPSNPFTGVIFNRSSQPIPNAALKTRIDKFIIDNQGKQHVRGVGRTVGSNSFPNSNHVRVSLLAGKSTGTSPPKKESNEPQTDKVRPAKRFKTLGETHQGSFRAVSIEQCDKPHESQVSESLDNALKSLLGDKRILKSHPVDQNKPKTCTACDLLLVTNVYLLPCTHLVCRQCLLNCNNVCSNCHSAFSSENVQRAHL